MNPLTWSDAAIAGCAQDTPALRALQFQPLRSLPQWLPVTSEVPGGSETYTDRRAVAAGPASAIENATAATLPCPHGPNTLTCVVT